MIYDVEIDCGRKGRNKSNKFHEIYFPPFLNFGTSELTSRYKSSTSPPTIDMDFDGMF